MKQGGYECCSICVAIGEDLPFPGNKRDTHRIGYLPSEFAPSRTHEMFIDDITLVDFMGEAVISCVRALISQTHGIKVLPVICKYLTYVDLVEHFTIDYMHALCLNIFLHFLLYWFTSKYSQYNFSLFSKKEEIEKHYLKFKFPYFNTRPARKLENFGDWKAIELRSDIVHCEVTIHRDFFLFVAPVLLWNQLPASLYSHMMLLVNSVWTLLLPFSREQLLDAKAKVICNLLVNTTAAIMV